MKKTLIASGLVGSTILLAFAQNDNGVSQNVGGSLFNLLAMMQGLVNRLIPLAIGLAILSLFIGIVMYIWEGKQDSAKHGKWLTWMGYSILALFVMVSVWGLVGFLGSIFGISQGGTIPVPKIPTGPTQ